MLESTPFVLILGTILGFLAGIGVGGGSLLILWLTIVLGMDPQMARSINLLFFLPSALISCIFRWRQGDLCIQKAIPGVIAGCICAAAGSWLSTLLDQAILKKLFGILLLDTGLRELLWKAKKTGRT